MRQRKDMVENQIIRRGVSNPMVLMAMRTVKRHLFVPAELKNMAYEDYPLSIGKGQTISQPYIVAYMTEQAKITSGDKVLEIGTGSGYQAAILGKIAKEVYAVEIIESLAESAAERLKALGYTNVFVKCANGHAGWPDQAPYDVIILTAAPPEIPLALVQEMKTGGRLIAPVGEFHQELKLLTKTPKGLTEKNLIPVRFVPMVDSAPKE